MNPQMFFSNLCRAAGTPLVRWRLAFPLAVLLLTACSQEHPRTAEQKAAAIADALAAGKNALAGGGAGVVCGNDFPKGGVEDIATGKLESLQFAWRSRCVRRVAQRPATLRIDEIEEIVAWKDGNWARARQAEAVFVAVSYEPPADAADSRGVWPLAAVLAALDAHTEDQDSLSRSVIVTLGAVPGWDILDAAAPDDTVAGALDSEYRNLLEVKSDSGPSPPLARPRQPGILIGLISQSDLPVLSHDPRDSMLAERSVYGHNTWSFPDGVSARTFGDMLVLEIANGVSADDRAVLSDLTGVVVRALKTVNGWAGPELVESSLLWDRRTVSWLLGIVLPIVFLGVGMWCLLCESLTNLGNAKRALRYTKAEVVRHLLWHTRTERRKGKGIARTSRRITRATRSIGRAERLRRQSKERIKRLDRIPVADHRSVPRTKRAAPRVRNPHRRKKALERHLEVLDGHLEGMNDHRELLERHRRKLDTARTRADSEATKVRLMLPDFPIRRRHGRGSDPRETDGSASGRSDADDVIKQLVSATRTTRMWLWVRSAWSSVGRVMPNRGAPAIRHPGDRCPEFVNEMERLASCLVCYRQYYDARRDIRKKRGQDIVGGVWNGIWRAITTSSGAWAFFIGAGSVIAALVLPRVAVQLAADTVAGLELNRGLWAAVKLAIPLVVVGGAYWSFRGYEHGRAVVWGAAALTMLGLTTIEFTALEADLADVFDSQRVTVMQLVIVAMLFIGQEFGNRAAMDRKQGLTDNQENLAGLLEEAERDLSKCFSRVRRLEGVADGPCGGFKASVKQAGARFWQPKRRECLVVLLVTVLYVAVCVHFVAPALSWNGLRPGGVLVHGDALNVCVVAGAVVLLPVVSLWSAWMETKRRGWLGPRGRWRAVGCGGWSWSPACRSWPDAKNRRRRRFRRSVSSCVWHRQSTWTLSWRLPRTAGL